jgi:hypothetical protein
MANPKKKYGSEAWDTGELGRDEQYVAVADATHDAALDEALGLQSISIRLPKELISQYKLIAHFHGVGYQPLMRDVMQRFVKGAMEEILQQQIKAADSKTAKTSLVSLRKAA